MLIRSPCAPVLSDGSDTVVLVANGCCCCCCWEAKDAAAPRSTSLDGWELFFAGTMEELGWESLLATVNKEERMQNQ